MLHRQVGYDKKEDFKKTMLAHKLNFGWDQSRRLWFGLFTDPASIAEVVAEGYDVLENPHHET